MFIEMVSDTFSSSSGATSATFRSAGAWNFYATAGYKHARS